MILFQQTYVDIVMEIVVILHFILVPIVATYCNWFKLCNGGALNQIIFLYKHDGILYVTGTEKGFGKETMRFGLSVIFRIFGVDTGGCADKLWQFLCTCTVVFPLKD